MTKPTKNSRTSTHRELSPLSGFSQFIKGAIRGRPRAVFLEVTLRCNARCHFCRYWKEKSHGDELQDFRPIVKHFSPVSVTLTGGEPLLRPDICEIVADIKSAGKYFVSLLTNGSRLDMEKARALRAAGLDGLSVSLNYPGPEQDQEKDLPGLYRHLSQLLPGLPSVGFRRLSLNTVLMAQNLPLIPSLLDRAKQWGVGMTVSCYSPNKAHEYDPVLRQEHKETLGRTVELLKAARREGVVENSDWYLDRILDFHRTGYIPGCTAGHRTVHVNPQGMVQPCPDMPAVSPWTDYDARKTPYQRCGACWYACRGEIQAPLTIDRMLALAHYVARRPPSRPVAAPAVGCHEDLRRKAS